MAFSTIRPLFIMGLLKLMLIQVIRTENYACPNSCICLRTFVECTKLGLLEVPQNLPYWVENLELQSNNIENLKIEDFQNLQELKYLDLSGNRLEEISLGSVLHTITTLTTLKLNKNLLNTIPHLEGLPNLSSLSLAHNLISNVSGVEQMTGIKFLDLSSNRISEIKPGAFPNNSALHSLNLNNNKISAVEKGSLDSLSNLVEMKLNRNKISDFPKELFKHLKLLKALELNRNHFTEIEGLAFKGLENLASLKLKHNSIVELLDGAFYELKKMSVLQLDYNNITSITKGWLYGLLALQHLSLSHNLVNKIEPDGWEFCSELIDIDLSYNQLQTIDKSTFDHLPKLQRLILNGNKISYIVEGAFNNTPSLQVLELNNNEISWTIEDMTGAFMSLGHLTKLDLSSNLIKSINKKAFMGLVSVKELDLRNNSITSVQEQAFSDMSALTKLHLNSSSLLCDCNLKWFPQWLASSKFIDTVISRCAHPQWLHNMLLSEVPATNFTCDDFPKPRLLEEPKKQVTIKGENITLVCRASSSSVSPMIFQWRKDNVELQTPTVQTARMVDGKISEHKSELQLFNISHNDAGKYQCIASNVHGTTYSQKSKISVLIFPSFTKTPSDLTLKSGSTAKLECAAKGEPKPQIAWQKDGGNDFPAARERRMHVIPADVIFFIVNVKPADMGLYSCTAQNEAGKIVANATLTVLETPTFVKAMENKEISAGDSTVLECMAAGSPKPKLTWSKDGEPLVATPRHFFTAENQLLIIVNTALGDAGNYQCEMSNTLGTERGSSRLTIIPSAVGTSSNDSVTGYIIISVVCCAVLTSICWVLIIVYQTRKRTSNTPPSLINTADYNKQEQDEQQERLRSSQHHLYLDNNSEHSSSDKDSGTGDSAQRSSDDLIMSELLLDSSQVIVCDIENNSACNNIIDYGVELATFHSQPTNHERCNNSNNEIIDSSIPQHDT